MKRKYPAKKKQKSKVPVRSDLASHSPGILWESSSVCLQTKIDRKLINQLNPEKNKVWSFEVNWFIYRLFNFWSIDWFIDFVSWPPNWFINWFIFWLIKWMIDWMIEWFIGWLGWSRHLCSLWAPFGHALTLCNNSYESYNIWMIKLTYDGCFWQEVLLVFLAGTRLEWKRRLAL